MAHLTRFQREQLEALSRAKQSQREIARILGCTQATVSRELARNSTGPTRRYTAHIAERRAAERRAQALASRPQWFEDLPLLAKVETELAFGRSPDQIAGRLRRDGWAHIVSHETIYAHIRRDAASGGDLWTFLRYQGKKHKWRGYGTSCPGIPNRRDISERPAEVEAKEEAGHWESDLVVSNRAGTGGAATFVERKTLAFRAVLVAHCTAGEMVQATQAALGTLPPRLRRTMTHDNGPEIVRHEDITATLGMVVYCARPYHSWERGLNEWYNRELRRFFPKGTDFATVTQSELDAAVSLAQRLPAEVPRLPDAGGSTRGGAVMRFRLERATFDE